MKRLPAALGNLLTAVALVLAIFAASRGLVRALPGDPIETLIAESGTRIPAEELRHEMGLDRPFLSALGDDLHRASHGDFGRSLLSGGEVGPLLFHRFANTLALTLLSLLLATSLSVLLGVHAARTPGSRSDRLCTALGAISASLPVPWIGPVLLLVFAVWVPIFPTGGGLLLPAITLALSLSGFWARLVRERTRDALLHGWADSARARGVPELKVLLKYGLWPVSGSLIAYLGTQVGALLGGAFVIEAVFDWKGIGSLLVDAVLKRDYPVVEGAVFVTAAAAVLGTRLGDWAQAAIDPRVADGELSESERRG